MTIKIKVCGMRNPSNIEELVKLNPDYIGFIFYPKSKRYIGTSLPEEIWSIIPASIPKVGVFVDESIDNIIELIGKIRLDIVQLHGNELPEYCSKLKDLNVPVIKAFSISTDFDFTDVRHYEDVCHHFLFDTASVLRGGSGLKFDWRKLEQYEGNKPFFLSGGIGPEEVERIMEIKHPGIYGVDVNSGFEVEPGIKDISKLRSFMDRLRNENGFRDIAV
jgi:phosphoribosylanthranilate isomerase